MMATMARTADAARPDTERGDDRADREEPRERRTRYRRARARLDRAFTLEVAAREYTWFYDHKHLKIRLEEIAGYEGLTIDRIRFGVERMKALESKRSKDDLVQVPKPGRLDDLGFRLTPLFPIGAFTPHSTGPHHDSIRRGSKFCCMVCHASGMDDHPALRRDPLTDPSPEPKPAPAPESVASSKSGNSRETRKQRRRRQFAEAAAVA